MLFVALPLAHWTPPFLSFTFIAPFIALKTFRGWIMTVLVTGSAGFIAGYLVQELLDQGHRVIGVDNFSKYGAIEKSYQQHPNYKFVQGDCKDAALLTALAEECEHFVAC